VLPPSLPAIIYLPTFSGGTETDSSRAGDLPDPTQGPRLADFLFARACRTSPKLMPVRGRSRYAALDTVLALSSRGKARVPSLAHLGCHPRTPGIHSAISAAGAAAFMQMPRRELPDRNEKAVRNGGGNEMETRSSSIVVAENGSRPPKRINALRGTTHRASLACENRRQ